MIEICRVGQTWGSPSLNFSPIEKIYKKNSLVFHLPPYCGISGQVKQLLKKTGRKGIWEEDGVYFGDIARGGGVLIYWLQNPVIDFQFPGVLKLLKIRGEKKIQIFV